MIAKSATNMPVSENLKRVGTRISFAWRTALDDLASRFRASLLGGAWLAIGPSMLIIVYWAVFDRVLGVEFTNPSTEEKAPFLAPFAIGFFLYLTFNELVSGGATWFSSRRRMIVETNLPIWTIYLVLAFRTLIQYAFYVVASIAVCAFYGLTTPIGVLAYVFVALIIFFIFAGVGLAISLIGVFFGDVREVMPTAMRVLFYVSSISFPLTAVPATLQWLPESNPLTWAVEASRSLLLWSGEGASDYMFGLTVAGLVVWTIAACLYWRLAAVIDQVV